MAERTRPSFPCCLSKHIWLVSQGFRLCFRSCGVSQPARPNNSRKWRSDCPGDRSSFATRLEQAIGLMTPFIQTQLQSMVAVFPNEVTFISGTASGTPADPRLKLNAARSAIKLALFMPVLFLFGIAIFVVRSLVDWLTWWGWPLMFAGGISVLIALFGSPVIGGMLQIRDPNPGSDLHTACAGCEHRRNSERGCTSNAGAGCDRGLHSWDCGVGDGHPGNAAGSQETCFHPKLIGTKSCRFPGIFPQGLLFVPRQYGQIWGLRSDRHCTRTRLYRIYEGTEF